MSLKFTGELYVMTMKNDVKFEEELTCQFKKSRNWDFDGIVLSKVENV